MASNEESNDLSSESDQRTIDENEYDDSIEKCEIQPIDQTTSISNSINMITSEASCSGSASADLLSAPLCSSVARILVKPGQIFRVQVDNEVKEVHGKLFTEQNSNFFQDRQLSVHFNG